jgi:hypothetical protein
VGRMPVPPPEHDFRALNSLLECRTPRETERLRRSGTPVPSPQDGATPVQEIAKQLVGESVRF